jgi:hypothetical protein
LASLNDRVHFEYWGTAKGVLEELCIAPHFTKMVKSSMPATLVGLRRLAILTVSQLPFLG